MISVKFYSYYATKYCFLKFVGLDFCIYLIQERSNFCKFEMIGREGSLSAGYSTGNN